MKKYPTVIYSLFMFACFVFSSVTAIPLIYINYLKANGASESKNQTNNVKTLDNISGCKRIEFDLQEVVFLNNTDIFLKSKNATVHSSDYHTRNDKVYACLNDHQNSQNELITSCKTKFIYDSHEFQILPNRSVLLFRQIIDPGEYELKGNQLLVCAMDDDSEDDWNESNETSDRRTLREVSTYVGKIGSGISIAALTLHLLTFCFIPSLRNLPGYNLASLSVAFLFAYSFVIIGQIPKVLGLFCVISGVLQQNFFLVAFFVMNVLAFDVWRTLKLATERLIIGSSNIHKRQFIWYSLYAWGCPLVISTISILLDNIDGVPEKIKPFFGKNDVCWMTNNFAKTIFFAVPAFSLFFINGFFFIRSSVMISTNQMKCTNDQQKQSVKLNYVLYLRLGLMMGLTWLMGIIALISRSDVVWFIHDLLNSLQGLFLFLLFTCTRKVVKHIKQKAMFHNKTSSTSEKVVSTVSSKVDSQK